MKSPAARLARTRSAIPPVGADEGRDGDDARLGEQFGHGADAADVLLAVLGRKAQAEPLGEFLPMLILEHAGPGVEPVADIVAIEDETVEAEVVEFVVHKIGHGALAAGASIP